MPAQTKHIEEQTFKKTGRISFLRSILFQPLLRAWRDLKQIIDVILTRHQEKPFLRIWFTILLGLTACWFIYVPVHELLHVAGCLITGGEVSELKMSALYGAEFLQKFFPFIVCSEEYAGRLTGFSTHGSDLIYLATVFMPFILTIMFGGILLQLAQKKASPFLFGISLVIAGAPFISLTGDYLEMGGILVTRLIAVFSPSATSSEIMVLYKLRSDDLFRLVQELVEDPLMFGIRNAFDWIKATGIIFLSQFTGLILAGWTYFLSTLTGRLLVR